MKFILILIAASLISLPVLANANKSPCSPTSVHCTSFDMSPPSDDPQDDAPQTPQGRYVKAIATYGNETDAFISCFDVASTIEVPAFVVDNGTIHVGDLLKAEYKQCKDRYCNQSIRIGEESFTIDKKPVSGYTSTPDSYTVKLNGAYGNACTPSFRKTMMIRERIK